MWRRLAHFSCLAACLSSTASFSANKDASPPAVTNDEQAIEIIAQKLCKAEPIVGTRIPVPRKCDTPAQLRLYNAQAREMIESYRQRTPCIMGMEVGEGKLMPC